MSIFEVGRICVKLAGRDAGRKCVVVEQLDNTFVVVDGDVRRKKVNVRHLEPTEETIAVKDKASHEVVKAAFEKQGWKVWDKKSKTVAARPVLKRKGKKEATSAKKVAEKPAKKVTKKKKEE